jgi:hypothetical protein
MSKSSESRPAAAGTRQDPEGKASPISAGGFSLLSESDPMMPEDEVSVASMASYYQDLPEGTISFEEKEYLLFDEGKCRKKFSARGSTILRVCGCPKGRCTRSHRDAEEAETAYYCALPKTRKNAVYVDGKYSDSLGPNEVLVHHLEQRDANTRDAEALSAQKATRNPNLASWAEAKPAKGGVFVETVTEDSDDEDLPYQKPLAPGRHFSKTPVRTNVTPTNLGSTSESHADIQEVVADMLDHKLEKMFDYFQKSQEVFKEQISAQLATVEPGARKSRGRFFGVNKGKGKGVYMSSKKAQHQAGRHPDAVTKRFRSGSEAWTWIESFAHEHDSSDEEDDEGTTGNSTPS